MKIGCLQFSPQVGDVNNNLSRADAVLLKANPDDLDLLVLPELAFTGYNFASLRDISPFLEPSGSGISALWARTAALKYNCHVVVGYPEKVDSMRCWPASPEYYNSAIVVNSDGETVANYRKNHLYFTDETWALESTEGFYEGFIPCLGQTSIGICMDLNPYRFQSPWDAFEFGYHILHSESNLVIVSMAWVTNKDHSRYSSMPNDPDLETLAYWATRLEPVIRAESEDEVTVVFCNRCGVEGDSVYAGTSAVIGIRAGEVNVYGLLGRGEKELLVVDTEKPPVAKMVLCPTSEEDLSPILPPQELSIAEVLHGVHLAEKNAAQLASPPPVPELASSITSPVSPVAAATSPDSNANSPRKNRPNPPRLRIPESQEPKVWKKNEEGAYQDETQTRRRQSLPLSAPVHSLASSAVSAPDSTLSAWIAGQPRALPKPGRAHPDSGIEVSPASFLGLQPPVAYGGPRDFNSPARSTASNLPSSTRSHHKRSWSASTTSRRKLHTPNSESSECAKFARFKDTPSPSLGDSNNPAMLEEFLNNLDKAPPSESEWAASHPIKTHPIQTTHLDAPDHITIAASPSVLQTRFPPIPPVPPLPPLPTAI